MKRFSLYFTAPRRVELREESFAWPQAGKILVQTLSSAVSAGTELLFYRDQVPGDLQVDETIPGLSGKFRYPLKYGYASVGKIIEIENKKHSSLLGSMVFSLHVHESHFCAAPDEVLVLPAHVQPEEAVFLPILETAVNFMLDGRPLIGERAAVFGQGVVGLLTTALLARFPLESIVTFDSYELRRKVSELMGARASFEPGGKREQSADITYELSGNPDALALAIESTAFSGRIVIGSWYGRKKATAAFGGRFHRSRIKLISSQVSTITPELSGRWSKVRRLETAVRMLEEINTVPLISHRFPFSRAPGAYELLDRSPEETLQVVFSY